MNGKRSQSPRLPELIHAGTIEVRHDLADFPVLFLSGWLWSDPDARAGRLDGPSWEAGIAACGGRSVMHLHEAAHGPGCKCPVDGFAGHFQHIGEDVRQYAHDEPLPYSPDMWKEAR